MASPAELQGPVSLKACRDGNDYRREGWRKPCGPQTPSFTQKPLREARVNVMCLKALRAHSSSTRPPRAPLPSAPRPLAPAGLSGLVLHDTHYYYFSVL